MTRTSRLDYLPDRFQSTLETTPSFIKAALPVGMALVAVAAFIGCSPSPARPSTSTSYLAATTFPNDKAAFDFFVGKGLTNFQAAGIVGNLDQESGVNPSSVQQPSGP